MPLNANAGDPAANSYATTAEGNAYYAMRLPLAGWTTPPAGATQDLLLMMATRVLNALAQPFKTFFPGTAGHPPYYRVRRQWLGAPATAAQALAWPRIGLLDANGNPLDLGIASVAVGNPTTITTLLPHRLVTGMQVVIYGTNSTPIVDGPGQVVTVTGTFTFTVPINVTIAGTGQGGVSWVPTDLKNATAEFAGQLGSTDRTLDNDVIVQGVTGVRAGSVSVSFKQEIIPQVIPDAVYNLMPQAWLTDELYVPANPAIIDVASRNPSHDFEEGWR